MMRVLITSGLSGKDIGGPFQYGARLRDAFEALGHEAELVSYGRVEKVLPPWIRHLYFLLKILPKVIRSDLVLALDVYSVGVPTALTSLFLGKRCVARVGGDYLWSAYVNRTGAKITLKEFYKSVPKLSLKEWVITLFVKVFLRSVDFLAFNTEWQRQIWTEYYGIPSAKTGVVRNFIPEKSDLSSFKTKNFLWAGRVIPEKNLEFIKKIKGINLDIVTGRSHDEVLVKIKECYAVFSPALTDICPNFILEGISFNKPFIMTRETGLGELYPKGGIFLDPKDENAWIRAFESMLEESAYNKYVGELEAIKQENSWSSVAKSFEEIWKRI